jgi:hypothetical protein
MLQCLFIAGLILAAAGAFGFMLAAAPSAPKVEGYTDTPIIPGQKWHVHDPERPQPPVVTPGTFSTEDAPGKPPSDAIVLFDGNDLSKWKDGKGQPSGWKVQSGYMMVPPKGTPGGGDIITKDDFGDCQLHVEWSAPTPPVGNGQGRGNSGVLFFGGRYEIQVVDSYRNLTYADGGAGSLYGQYPPLVNACRKPGEWQVYDIIFMAPRFKDGKLETPGYVTLIHNGLVMHNHTALLGTTAHKSMPKYSPHEPKGPIKLQDHGNPVRYRNIWIRPLKDYDQP